MPIETDKGLVFRIEKYMISDGVGIRTNVFLKGCPLRCKWCFNPEGIEGRSEILVFKAKCINCGECQKACPNNAISLEEGYPKIDRTLCDACGNCVSVCPSLALEMCGKPMTIGEILDEVRKDEVFYRRSGGGVTITGGELAAQPKFARELLLACKQEFHTAIETSGFAPWPALKQIITLADQVFFDLKHMNSKRHKELTGVTNELILENLKRSSRAHPSITTRIPLVPGLNDSPENIRKTAKFVRALGTVTRIELLPYVTYGSSKYEMLDLVYGLPDVQSPSADLLRDRVGIVKDCGVDCIVTS